MNVGRSKNKNGASRPNGDGGGDGRNRIKTSIHFEPENHKLLAIASIESGLDMSVIVNNLVREKFAGWHIRKGNVNGRGVVGGLPGAEGSTADNSGQDNQVQGGAEAPELNNGRPTGRKSSSGPIKGGEPPEGQSFGLVTERSAYLDHDLAIDKLTGNEEAA